MLECVKINGMKSGLQNVTWCLTRPFLALNCSLYINDICKHLIFYNANIFSFMKIFICSAKLYVLNWIH